MKKKNQNDKWDAEHYKKHSEGQFNRGLSIIYGINFIGNENILDIGSGDGRITAEIAKLVPQGHVLGVDISPNMVTEAKKSFGDIGNLAFMCTSAADFSSNKKFDFAVSFATFHWIKNQFDALKNIYDHLRPGGKLFIKTGAVCKGPVSEVYELKKWATFFAKREETYFPQTAESFSDLLKSAGFHDIDVKRERVEHLFKDKKELFNTVFSWVPHATGLPDDKARKFTQDIVDRVCATRDDGQIIFETALLDARVVK